MAVQTHYSSTTITQDFRTQINYLEGMQKVAGCEREKSDMTSITSLSRKRAREVDLFSPVVLSQQNMGIQQQFQQPNMVGCCPANAGLVNGLQPCITPMQTQMYAATGTSSGKSAIEQQLSQQWNDIESLVHLHTEKMRLGLIESRKRHCRGLLLAAQQQVEQLLLEKEMMIVRQNQQNAELEEKVRQLVTESHFWFNVAKNNEAVACSLRASVVQALNPPAKEGFGETEGVVNPAADDAQSCCDGGDYVGRQWACKSCGMEEASLLLLPCKHLCLCKDCESKINSCPVCNSDTKLCIHISAIP